MHKNRGQVIGAWCIAAGAVGMCVCVLFYQWKYGILCLCAGILLALVTGQLFRERS